MKKLLSFIICTVMILSVFAIAPFAASAAQDDPVVTGDTEHNDPVAQDFTYKVTGGKVTITAYLGEGGDVVIPSVIDGCTVTQIGAQAFYDLPGITGVTIPDTVTSIGNYAFLDCAGLTQIDIPASVKRIGESAFLGCSGLTSIVIPASVAELENFTFQDCGSLTSVTIPASVKSIDNYVFADCPALMSVIVPDTVTYIGEKAFGYITGDSQGDKKVDGFTIRGSKDSKAHEYAQANGFTLLYTYTDKATGISLELSADYSVSVKALTGQQADEVAAGLINPAGVYSIAVTKGGSPAQPDSAVKVQIPCADENAKLFLRGSDGSYTEIAADSQDSIPVFKTASFGEFIIAEGKKPLLGDADGDGEVSILDATVIQRHIAELPTENYVEESADADGDGAVTILDATAIQRWLDELPANPNIGKAI